MRIVVYRFISALILIILLNNCGVAYMSNRSKLLDSATETDYGPAIPENSEELTKEAFEMILKDPDSAKYKFGEIGKDVIPKKFFSPDAITVRVQTVFVNAKNSYGGYTGMKKYQVAWKDGKIYALIPEDSAIIFMQ